MGSFEGKIGIVTGGGWGLGEAILFGRVAGDHATYLDTLHRSPRRLCFDLRAEQRATR